MRVLFAVALLALTAATARAEELVHGADSVLSRGHYTIVWAVLRAADEADTDVVIRIAATSRYDVVSVDAVDPFTGRRQGVLPRSPLAGQRDVRRRRAAFAELPRLEIHLHEAQGSGAVSVTVFYLGVPDTTPEFSDEADLRRYLDDAIVRVRGGR